MVFMRRHGAEHSMHKVTCYAASLRAATPESPADEPIARLPAQRLAAVAKQLDAAVARDLAKRGVCSNAASPLNTR